MSHRLLLGPDADLLIVASPVQDPDTVLPDKVDLSVSKYADDVVKIIPAEENCHLASLLDRTQASMQTFNEETSKVGYAQNMDKIIRIVAFTGPGSRTEIQALAKQKRSTPVNIAFRTKSLGSTISATGSASAEIAARLAAVRKAKYQSRRMWAAPGIPWKLRRIAIISHVQGTALSGLESFVVSDRQASSLDSAIAQVGREALQGKACKRDAEGKVESSMTNRQILHYWDIASSATELRIRRLK